MAATNLLKAGRTTMTEALRPVPRFDGQVPKKPKRSFHIREEPDFLAASWIERKKNRHIRRYR
jgi:hypothetical protein